MKKFLYDYYICMYVPVNNAQIVRILFQLHFSGILLYLLWNFFVQDYFDGINVFCLILLTLIAWLA